MNYHPLSLQRWASLCFVLLLLGCGGEQKLEPLPKDATILAFGDSLTAGVGGGGTNYPEVLAQLTGLNVINAGISGETTTEGVPRFIALLDEKKPDLVILLEGGNDVLRNKSRRETKQNLEQMIQRAQGYDVALVLLGVPEKKLFSDSAPIYEELAQQYDLVFDEDMIADLLRSPKLKSDPIHLNAAGYRKLAEQIKDLLADNGAL